MKSRRWMIKELETRIILQSLIFYSLGCLIMDLKNRSLKQTLPTHAKWVTSDSVRSCVLSRVWLFMAPWSISHQAPLSMEFSRQEYWSGLSSPPPGDLPDLGIKPAPIAFPALAGEFFIPSAPRGSPSDSLILHNSDWNNHVDLDILISKAKVGS